MSIGEAERAEIYEALKRQHGERIASNLMSMLPPVGWADVATKADLASWRAVLSAEFQAELGAVRGDFAELRGEFAELRGEFAGLRGEFAGLRGEFVALGYRVEALGSDLRTEMHQSIRNQTWALVAWTTGWTTALAGLFVAFGR